MSAPPYQKFFWGSYHKHTAHLRGAKEHGAYLLLIAALWNNEGRLPGDDDTLAAYAQVTLKEWQAMKPKLLRPTLLKLSRGKLMQDRVTEDLAKYCDTSGKRKAAGKIGGEASASSKKENRQANATDLPTKPEPEPEPKEESANALFVVAEAPTAAPKAKPKKRRDYPSEFEAVWRAYPHHEGRSSKPNAFAQWERLPEDEREAIPGAIAAFKLKVGDVCGGKGAPDMALWLKDDKHLTWMAKGMVPALPLADHAPFPSAGVRQLVVVAKGETWAKTWLDQCRWDQPTKTIICPRQLTVDRLRAEVPDLELKGATITITDPNTAKSRSAA